MSIALNKILMMISSAFVLSLVSVFSRDVNRKVTITEAAGHAQISRNYTDKIFTLITVMISQPLN